jgi:hypothetical protein
LSSPAKRTKPPIGIQPSRHSTPDLSRQRAIGRPKPMANWSILAPTALPARKWPSSWTVITIPIVSRNGMTMNRMLAKRPFMRPVFLSSPAL